LNIIRRIIGVTAIAGVLFGFFMCVYGLLGAGAPKPPVEIDPTARIYTISNANRGAWRNVKDPVFHQNGGVSFKDSAGKEVIFGPAVQWVAIQE